MKVDPRAGQPAIAGHLVGFPKLIAAYYEERPDPNIPEQRVVFSTSGDRGSSFDKTFDEGHILVITQAICLYRKQQKIDAPLSLKMTPRRCHSRSSKVYVRFWLRITDGRRVSQMVWSSLLRTVRPTRIAPALVCADGWLCLDHEQGWHYRRPAGSGDHCGLQEGPGKLYAELTGKLGNSRYRRSHARATNEQKVALEQVTANAIHTAGLAISTKAAADANSIGGIKVVAANGWFAARRLGTEAIYKIYAESLSGEEH